MSSIDLFVAFLLGMIVAQNLGHIGTVYARYLRDRQSSLKMRLTWLERRVKALEQAGGRAIKIREDGND